MTQTILAGATDTVVRFCCVDWKEILSESSYPGAVTLQVGYHLITANLNITTADPGVDEYPVFTSRVTLAESDGTVKFNYSTWQQTIFNRNLYGTAFTVPHSVMLSAASGQLAYVTIDNPSSSDIVVEDTSHIEVYSLGGLYHEQVCFSMIPT